jgi:hypothetical protein
MFTLAHISDIHLGPMPDLSILELMSKRITGYVNWHRNRRKQLFGDTHWNICCAISPGTLPTMWPLPVTSSTSRPTPRSSRPACG